jgi:hypothetical protein
MKIAYFYLDAKQDTPFAERVFDPEPLYRGSPSVESNFDSDDDHQRLFMDTNDLTPRPKKPVTEEYTSIVQHEEQQQLESQFSNLR